MKKDFKRTVAFIFFLLGGITLGAFISYICKDRKYIDWLSWGKQIGLSADKPAVLDLEFLKIAFGFTLKVTIAQIFTVVASIFIFAKTCKHL